MSLTFNAPPTAITAEQPRGHRDQALDLLRFACLIVVVVLHSMMSGAVLGAEGEIVPTVALSHDAGFTIASWFFQIMPLFFFIGGYASLNGWRRTQAKGGGWSDYLAARLRRLVIPVMVLIGVAGLALAIASEVGVPAELLAEASTRIGQPLWFLAVYVGLTCLVPLAAHFHEIAPKRTIAALAGAVIAVDCVVELTGMTGLGYLNFLFVWPLIQQCGFFFADALHRPVRTWLHWSVMVIALISLGGLVALGVYSPNMLVNLNPPTGALVLLGLAQMSALRLGHAWLTALVEGSASASATADAEAVAYRARIWNRVIAWGNDYGIHVYLWHMPIVITLIGGLGYAAELLSGAHAGGEVSLSAVMLPEIESTWWWVTRVFWLITVMSLSAMLATTMSKVPFLGEEKLVRLGHAIGKASVGNSRHNGEAEVAVSSAGADPNVRQGIAAVGLAMAGIAIALLIGIAPLLWTLVSVGLLLTSLILAAGLKLSADANPTNLTRPIV